MNIETIRNIVQKSGYHLTTHAYLEALKDGISSEDIHFAIFHGKIIEEYPEREYKDIESCLIYAMLATNIQIHISVDVMVSESVVVVTVYVPDRSQWIASQIRKQRKRRKGKRK